MIILLKENLWKQFGASIDMLKNAILMCPEDYWGTNKKLFYLAYHCLIFLDYYLTIPPREFSTALPFTMAVPDDIPVDAVDDIIPNRVYSKDELLNYLQLIREKCHNLIAGLTEERLKANWSDGPDRIAAPGTLNYSVLEILLYNMRHVQHHAAQLNLLLRQVINNAPDWVFQAGDAL